MFAATNRTARSERRDQRPIPQADLQILFGKALAFKETLDQRVVRFGDVLDQGFPLRGHFILQVRGDFRGFAFPVLAVEEGLLSDEIDHPFELGLGADRQLQDDGLGLEHLLRLCEDPGEVGPFAVHLVDEDHPRQLEIVEEIPALLGLDLYAVHRVDDDHGGVGGLEAGLCVGEKILVARRVQQRDGVFFPVHLTKAGAHA